MLLTPGSPRTVKKHELECQSFQKALNQLPDARLDLPPRSGLLVRRSLPALGIQSRRPDPAAGQLETGLNSATSEPAFNRALDSGIGMPLSSTHAAPIRSALKSSLASDDTFMEPRTAKSSSWPGVSQLPPFSDIADARGIAIIT